MDSVPDFISQFVRLSAWLLLLLVLFGGLERLVALHPQKLWRPQFGTDLGYYFLNGLTLKFLLVLPASVLASAAHALVPPGLPVWVAAWPFWARVAATFLVAELGFYWGHRWTHEIPLLWRFHSIHHSAPEMDWLVATRAHPVDIVFTRLCGFAPLFIFGLATPLVSTFDVTSGLVVVFGTLWGVFIHANLRWRLPWLHWLLATPAFHHWHHTNDAFRDRNYAPSFPIFDRIFGTYHMPKSWPTEYGIDAAMPTGLGGQLVNPFVRHAEEASAIIHPDSGALR